MKDVKIKVKLQLINNDSDSDYSKCYGCQFLTEGPEGPYCSLFHEYLPSSPTSFFNRLKECKNAEIDDEGEIKNERNIRN